MKKIKFGIVGYGQIGQRHAQHILNNTNSELIAICDIDKTKLDLITNTAIKTYTDLRTMLDEADIDVVNVCTPNYLHCDNTVLSLKMGKHVVCEKPMAISTTECNKMIATAEETNKTIFVVKQNRYNEPVQLTKQLLEENKLGKIFLVNINCFWNRNETYYNNSNWKGDIIKDKGILYTQFSHFVDILYYFFGYCKPNYCTINNFAHNYIDIEDNGIAVLESRTGALINLNFSNCAYNKNMEGAITIIAEKGTIKIGGQYLNTIEYQNIEGITLPNINIEHKNNDYGTYQGSMSNHDKVIQNVIDTLNGNSNTMTTAEEGREVVKMIERMYELAL
jgi:UDP-N-acetyl-2-amino-2-deoxyglucuronate dehydrogenase